MMRRGKLEHLVTTGMIKGKCSRRTECEKMLDGLKKWFKVGRVADILKAEQDKDAEKVMMVYAIECGT